jgi:hypothetical protein
MLVIDYVNESFHKDRVVRRIVMAAAPSAQITVRGDSWSDAGARMANRNLQMMTQVDEHARRGCEQRRAESEAREATHFDAYGASIESACVPGIIGEIDHLRRLTAVLANDVVRRDTRPARFEPSDRALVPSQSCKTMRSTRVPPRLEKLGTVSKQA